MIDQFEPSNQILQAAVCMSSPGLVRPHTWHHAGKDFWFLESNRKRPKCNTCCSNISKFFFAIWGCVKTYALWGLSSIYHLFWGEQKGTSILTHSPGMTNAGRAAP